MLFNSATEIPRRHGHKHTSLSSASIARLQLSTNAPLQRPRINWTAAQRSTCDSQHAQHGGGHSPNYTRRHDWRLSASWMPGCGPATTTSRPYSRRSAQLGAKDAHSVAAFTDAIPYPRPATRTSRDPRFQSTSRRRWRSARLKKLQYNRARARARIVDSAANCGSTADCGIPDTGK